ncbi:YvrJ family protein [Mesobacillus maritimus]|uniref:YvrJ family protein n=1 Tax=Mesobacillus maritimus TaxID=1643336 RepID=A0ABS7KAV9_9BACI|nr:YvrJ family protein [Mesobacillus maritimus]MBY0099409.1 YvrJ family protein [Mesobacillus maritimus]
MQELIPLISEVGFPVVVTLYLLHRIEAKLDTVVQSIQNLPNQMKENDYQDRKII